ncbi:zf-HC2 domain-containing protein [Promicromonospora sp. CA-289599]|uniref:zf-HC2 domain-containing protein n=1 Tax=Promicromonospora sp. CA-289599 TaxID=3240014 RepID=UPI003D94CE3A
MTATGDLRVDWVVHRPNVVRSVAARVPGIDAERHADVTMLRTALSDLADDDRNLLLERHLHDRAVADIATTLGVRPHAVTMRLRRAEERLAGAFAAAHAQDVNEPECRTTRAAMHDYLKGRLLPRRQRRLEVHMDGCAECTRAFVDVREVSWMLRDLGQHLIAGGWATGAVGTGAIGVGAVGAGKAQPRSVGKKEAAVAAGVLAVLAVGAGAAALIADQDDEPPIQALEEGAAAEPPSLPGPPEPPAQERPPAIPPADPKPRPATTPKEDAVPVPAPEQKAAEPEPEPADDPPSAPDIEQAVDRPAPQAPADKPAAPEPAPTPKPKPEPAPKPTPPPAVDSGGPPGNPGNPNGRGPTTYDGQGPGTGNGRGNGQDDVRGNGQGHGNRGGIGKGNGRSYDHGRQDMNGFTVALPGILLGGIG